MQKSFFLISRFAQILVFSVLGLLPFCGGDHEESKSHSHTDSQATLETPKKADKVVIEIKWEYSQLPLKMEIREPAGSQILALWTTGSVPAGKNAPFGKEIPDSTLILKPGSKKQFLLVMKNDSDVPVYFFAAPHQALPVEHSFGFKFKCLCVNHAFTVPPKETWYRVVEIRLAPEFLGDRLILTHNLLGMSKERMTQFEKSAQSNIPHEMD